MPSRMWHDAQARSGVGKTVAGIEPAQPILQQIYPFPDTATKPAWLRPSDKYIPSRTCMARKDDLERGKPARNMKDCDRSEIQPHSDAMHANAVGLKRTEREYCLRYIHWGMRPLRAPNNGRKRRSVPLRIWTLDDLWHAKAQQSRNHSPAERFKPLTAFRFKKHRGEFCMPAARNRSRGWPPGFERFRGKSSA